MKQNITLSLDSELLRAVKRLAAQKGLSVSELFAAELDRLVRKDVAYQQARARALRVLESGLHLGGLHPKRG